MKLPDEVSGIWEEIAYLERFDGDIELVAAALLGRQTRSIARDASIAVVQSLLTGKHVDAFVVDMDARLAARPSRSPDLVEAFKKGFIDASRRSSPRSS